MDNIPGSELAKAVVELHALTQIKGPFFEVRAGLPLFRQARNIISCLGVDVEQRLQKGVILQMLGAGNGPKTVALGEPGGAKDDALPSSRLCRCRRWRGQQHCGQQHQAHEHRGTTRGQHGPDRRRTPHEAPPSILPSSREEGY